MRKYKHIRDIERFHCLSLYNHVIQSNQLACATSNLSINAKRLLVAAISSIRNKNSEADTEDKEFFKTKLSVADLKKTFNIKSNRFHKQIDEATKELYNSSIYIHDTFNKRYIAHHIMISCYYYYNEGAVEFLFNDELKTHLLQLREKYADVPLQYLLKMKTPNSMDLLVFLFSEFNISYHSAIKKAKKDKASKEQLNEIKSNFHKTITVSKLKLMQLFMSDSFYLYQTTKNWGKLKYDSFARLNANAIIPAKNEINKSKILKVEVKNLRNDTKHPRTVTDVEFSITVGENMIEFDKQRKEHSKELQEHKELERVAEYYSNRFGTYQGYLINFVREHNYNIYVMKLSAILLQSYLEMSSCGRYVEDAWKENDLVGIRCKDPLKFLSRSFNDMSFIYDINDFNKKEQVATNEYYIRQYVGDMTLDEELGNKNLRAEIDVLFDKALQSTYNNPNEDYYE